MQLVEDVVVIDSILEKVNVVWWRIFGSSKLKQYEIDCITELRNLLKGSVSDKLDMQIERYNLIQRPGKSMKTLFFDVSNCRKTRWSDDVLFENRKANLKVCKGIVRGTKKSESVDIPYCIYIHEGRLSSIEFESSPELLDKYHKNEIAATEILVTDFC